MPGRETPKALCCVSGGMDSAVALAEALAKHGDAVILHCSYGQRTGSREERAVRALAEHYGCRVIRYELPVFDCLRGASSLVDETMEVEEGELDRRGVPSTYVPFRNGILLSVAAAAAESLGASCIYLGVVEEDGSGYPDCRRSFVEAMERAVALGTRCGLEGNPIRIETPLVSLDKAGIVRRGRELDVPFELTWSCYRNEGEIACGRCDSCLLRLRGFMRAGYADPLRYEKVPDWYGGRAGDSGDGNDTQAR